MPEYPKEQLWELYKNLPEELQKAADSQENSHNIREVCLKNGLDDEDIIFEIIKSTGYVFLGLLPPNEFSYILEKELKIKKVKAEEIAAEITRFVFLPVRESLEALYQMKIKPTVKPGAEILTPREVSFPTKKKSEKKDVYREPVE